jgi:DNA-binding protein HU-beta
VNKKELISQVAHEIAAGRNFLKASDVINLPPKQRGRAIQRLRLEEKIDSPPVAAEKAIKAIFESITIFLQKGENVQLIGFGTFSVKQRPARTARNLRTGEKMQIPAKRFVKFSPGKTLKEAVSMGSAAEEKTSDGKLAKAKKKT